MKAKKLSDYSKQFTEEQLKGIKEKLNNYDEEHTTSTISFEDLTQPLHNFRYSDPVDHPMHYNQGNVECIDAMQSAFGTPAVMNFCICNAFKYLWRSKNKGGMEDINKAMWYLNKYLELGETNE